MDAAFTRRKLLLSAGTTVSTGLAGCSEGGDGTPTGGATDVATDTPTASSSGTTAPTGRSFPVDYREWLPRPALLGPDYYYFNADDYTQLRADDDRFAQSIYDDYIERDVFDILGLGIDDVTYAIRTAATSFPTPSLVHGQFSKSAIDDRLQSLDYAVAQERETDTIYRAPDSGRFIGARDGVVALSPSSTQEVAVQLSTPDDEDGGYTDESDDLVSVLDAVGYGTFLFGGTTVPPDQSQADPATGRFAGRIANAYADTVTGERTRSTFAYRFEDEAAADAADVEAYFDSGSFHEYENVTIRRDGRNVVVEGAADTDELYT